MSIVDSIYAVIRSGNFDLEKIIERIRFYHVKGDLSDNQCADLIEAARAKAIDTIGIDSKKEILALWETVHALEKRVEALEHKADPEPEPEPETYPEWVQPTGAHDAYNIGDRVMYKGDAWESTINANVWSPEVYPAGWKKIPVPNEAEEEE